MTDDAAGDARADRRWGRAPDYHGRAWLRLAAALLWLNAAVAFLNWWPTPAIRWTGLISIEFVVVVAALSLWRERHQTPARGLWRLLTALWLVLAVGRYAQVTAPALWGRELNFYWDLQFVPDVAAMLARATHWSLLALVVVVLFAAAGLGWASIAWAFRQIDRATDTARPRRVLAGASLMLAAWYVVGTFSPSVGTTAFARPVVHSYARQARFVVDAWIGTRQLPASPRFDGDFAGIAGADVLLVFVESYGAITYDRPEFAAQLSMRRALLEGEIANGNRGVVSAFVTSPTFGGSSWFAHITLLSGIPVSDADTNALLMTEKRDTLPLVMSRHGYRSIALMPGLWSPWPEGAFYGFSQTYTGQGLQYPGPPFGWWDLPDQYSLARFDQLELERTDRRPLFLFFPTISTHTPFVPTPPYQPDWPRLLTDHPFDDDVLERVYDETVDWGNLGPGYAKATNYALETLTGYLARHRNRDLVMIVIGDHQPPALVTGEGAPWDVPVHVITNRREVLARLRAQGFRDGLTPTRPVLGDMASLLPVLLRSFQ